MKYTKKPVTIEATQWFKPGDHPEVSDRSPEIVFDSRKHYFYVNHVDQSAPRPNAWLAVDETVEEVKHAGVVLPFAFYELKSGERKPASEHPELLARYMAEQKWEKVPGTFGYIMTLEGGHIVTPGDWIITGVKGEFYPCKPDIFAASYNPAKENAHGHLPPHQQRVWLELGELEDRSGKLDAFLATPIFKTLPGDEQERLVRQLSCMGEYREILKERIAAFPSA